MFFLFGFQSAARSAAGGRRLFFLTWTQRLTSLDAAADKCALALFSGSVYPAPYGFAPVRLYSIFCGLPVGDFFHFVSLNVLCFANAAQTGVGQNLRTLAAHLFKMFVFSFSLRMAVKRAGPGFLNQNAAC
ncbi:hypothetical protein [Candidatus Avelusimicrobium alvi]|uniref:hypothetical protein n=1 Tax=Candidatus Avelusimicrobium alvi TaxID=3416221 RepID=UPI003D0EFF4C